MTARPSVRPGRRAAPLAARVASLFAAALFSGCAARGAPDAAGGAHRDAPLAATTFAFVGVDVIPMTTRDALLPDQTVIVSGDRITAVGPSRSVRVPAGATRIDGRGRFLIPGLADMHVHLEYFEHPGVLDLFLANGVTTVRNMDGREYILEWKRRVAEGALRGPTIVTAGPVLDGDPPVLPDNTVVSNAAEARSQVMAQAAAGYDFVKVYTGLSADAYHAVVRAAAEHGMPVAGHVPRSLDLADVLGSAQVSIEHLADLGGWIEADHSPHRGRWHWTKLYLAFPIDTLRLRRAASRIAESEVWIVPTMIQPERAVATADVLARWLAAPELSHVPESGRRVWRERVGRAAARMDSADWVLMREGERNRELLVRTLHAAGVRLLAGTDTPNPFVVPGYSLLEELEELTGAGLRPWDALSAATRSAALFLGELEEWGTIVEGKRADLVLLHANPLDDIRHLRRRAGVMVRGAWLAETELEMIRATVVLR